MDAHHDGRLYALSLYQSACDGELEGQVKAKALSQHSQFRWFHLAAI
jgi:hypothetical protein